MKAATRGRAAACGMFPFQSTPPVKAATRQRVRNNGRKLFQSTPPVKAATLAFLTTAMQAHISIHAAREGGDPQQRQRLKIQTISIHAAREGGDVVHVSAVDAGRISIHAAREGGDSSFLLCLLQREIFQSTPPVKAATGFTATQETDEVHFNPRRP